LRVSRLLRVAVAVALTAFVLRKSDPARVFDVAARADLGWIAAACGLVVLDRMLMAYRWWVLLCALDPGTRPPLGTVLRIFFVSTFVGTFLPSVGGDLYRAYSLARYDVRGAQAAASVLMDRLLGVLSILAVGAAGLAGARPIASTTLVVATLAASIAACGVGFGLVFSERVAALGRAAAARVPIPRVQRLGGDLIDAVRRFARSHGELAAVLALSVAVQIIRTLQAWCLGRSLHMVQGLPVYFALVPVILLIMLLPVTINGLGTSQAAFVVLFGQAGSSDADAFALSVLFVALGVVGNLPGALLYATGASTPPQDTRRDVRT
jgi:glycosyltransferase 2 family protein